MKTNDASWRRAGKTCMACALFLLISACSSLLPAPTPTSTIYSLDDALPARPASAPPAPNAPVVIVTPPRAAPGFDRPRMVYVKQPHRIEYFAQNQWVEAPQRMLAPLIVSTLDRSGKFRAVLQTPSVATGQIRLETEVVRLQHEFIGMPSQVRFTLRAHVLDEATRGLLGTREFEAVVVAPSADPYGGVVAANQAVAQVLAELADFCVAMGQQSRPATAVK
jgi:cholesterol transport system auxiliary component